MAVYLFTLHAYRSWMPDHRRGYVRRGQGILKSDTQQKRAYEARAVHDRMIFDNDLCRQIAQAVPELCRKRRWRLHGMAVVWTHLHVVVSWRPFVEARRARALLKHAITIRLRDHRGGQRKWLAGGGSVKRVRDRRHLDYLLQSYLPAHRRYGGVRWFEP